MRVCPECEGRRMIFDAASGLMLGCYWCDGEGELAEEGDDDGDS